MSNFVVGVGGTGAKFAETIIHLSAAGLLADQNGKVDCLLVDPDVANGNVTVTRTLGGHYQRCNRHNLQLGTTDLFATEVALNGPWTPVVNPRVATLSTFFGYAQMRENEPEEADLMELLFAPEERNLPIHQGFRGRPAIGSTIFSKAINFKAGAWHELIESVRSSAANQETVPVVLAGSVFGGSGAAGVPTICRLLRNELLRTTKNARLGLVLFLPYFTFRQVPGEEMQADAGAFDAATAESLKYYDEGHFLKECHAIYALGEEARAEMRVSAVGAEEQQNDPHFLELVGGLAATAFMRTKSETNGEHPLCLAVRKEQKSVRWADLPVMHTGGRDSAQLRDKQILRLQRMILFAVAYRYIFYPNIVDDIRSGRKRHPFVRNHLVRQNVSSDAALHDLAVVSEYVDSFLNWLLNLSTPAGLPGFEPGLVKLSVFAVPEGGRWRLKHPKVGLSGEYRDREIEQLFLNADGRVKPRFNDIWHGADRDVKDPGAAGTGRLIRAIYDACSLN